jgi:hypothetical protein
MNKSALSSIMVSGVYGGGPFYKNGTTAIPALQASGFTEAIVWNIAVDAAGNLNFNGEFPLVEDGEYIGGQTYPRFAEQIATLKSPPSSVTRLTFSIGSSNIGVFQNIQTLIASQGTGSDSILYRNFQALKAAFPTLDAIDFDDENCYDNLSMVAFAVMLGELGYDVTLCPFDFGKSQFWTTVAANANNQRPGTVTAIHLQCYSGGGANSPCTGWDFGDVPVYPGLSWDTSTPLDVQQDMGNWIASCGITGGFIWLFDHIYQNTALTQDYANAINLAISTSEA